jgi:hypothetical protein
MPLSDRLADALKSDRLRKFLGNRKDKCVKKRYRLIKDVLQKALDDNAIQSGSRTTIDALMAEKLIPRFFELRQTAPESSKSISDLPKRLVCDVADEYVAPLERMGRRNLAGFIDSYWFGHATQFNRLRDLPKKKTVANRVRFFVLDPARQKSYRQSMEKGETEADVFIRGLMRLALLVVGQADWHKIVLRFDDADGVIGFQSKSPQEARNSIKISIDANTNVDNILPEEADPLDYDLFIKKGTEIMRDLFRFFDGTDMPREVASTARGGGSDEDGPDEAEDEEKSKQKRNPFMVIIAKYGLQLTANSDRVHPVVPSPVDSNPLR